jgi:hypothetical protein
MQEHHRELNTDVVLIGARMKNVQLQMELLLKGGSTDHWQDKEQRGNSPTFQYPAAAEVMVRKKGDKERTTLTGEGKDRLQYKGVRDDKHPTVRVRRPCVKFHSDFLWMWSPEGSRTTRALVRFQPGK